MNNSNLDVRLSDIDKFNRNHNNEQLRISLSQKTSIQYPKLYNSIDEALENNELIASSYNLAKQVHEGDKRESGEDYFENHLVPVTQLVIKYSYLLPEKDQSLAIASALLHDSKEDNKVTREILEKYLDEPYGTHVSLIATIMDKKHRTFGENDVFLIGETNPAVGLILICDRLHNLHTLGYKKSMDAKKEYVNPKEIRKYVELANQHGWYELASELTKHDWGGYLLTNKNALKGEYLDELLKSINIQVLPENKKNKIKN